MTGSSPPRNQAITVVQFGSRILAADLRGAETRCVDKQAQESWMYRAPSERVELEIVRRAVRGRCLDDQCAARLQCGGRQVHEPGQRTRIEAFDVAERGDRAERPLGCPGERLKRFGLFDSQPEARTVPPDE